MTKPKPKPVTVRLAAAKALSAVIDEPRSLDDAIESAGSTLNERHHPLFKALCYGSVRWALWYQSVLNSKLKKPFKAKDRILNALLITALYELDHMRSAKHAVVDEAVKATRVLRREWAKNIVNAVLRNYLRETADTPFEPNATQLYQCYPDWLTQQIKQDWPIQAIDILRASLQHPPMTLRINQRLTTRDAYLERLKADNINAIPTAQSPIGVTLDSAISVSALPRFSEGDVSVQDESAQLSVLHLDLQKGQHVLDACAAPGGKTGLILETESELASVTAVDFKHRLDRLHANMQRLNFSPKVISLSKQQVDDTSWWDGTAFDRILLDAPCSGTGVMRRHPDIKFRRNPENSLQFAAQQSALLHQCWAMLKPGGLLMYTTCSILHLENDQQVAQFVASNADASVRPLPKELGLETTNGRQRLPGIHSGDGFYYSLLEKC